MTKDCPACNGTGRNVIAIMDDDGEDTGKRSTTSCVPCGGTGKL